MGSDFDLAVLGAGPAGANAALGAAERGLSVVLIDEQAEPGGQVWRAKSAAILAAPSTPETRSGGRLRADVSASTVTHLADARLWQIERRPIEERGSCWHLHVLTEGGASRITAKAVILASGAREFVQPVPGWTTPGVIGLAGATALMKQDLVVPGKATVVAGTGPLVFFVASEIRRLGGKVVAVVTPNSIGDWLWALPAMLPRADLLSRGALWIADLILAGIPIRWRHAVSAVQGDEAVTGVEIRKLDAAWAPRGSATTMTADSVCLGNGLIPAIEAAQLAGLSVAHDPALGGWVPDAAADGSTAIEGLFVCGDGAGIRGALVAEIQGKLAGLGAAANLGCSSTEADHARLLSQHGRAARFGLAMTALSIQRPGLAALTDEGTIVCRCEGISRAAIQHEIDAGAVSTNAVKSGLRAGMGPCGGKFCQTAVARMIAASAGRSEADVPPPTPRPPLRPIPVEAMAGDIAYDDLSLPEPAPL